MEYHSIKVHVPTPEISKLVQEKLFEAGCSWLGSGGCVKYTDYKYLFVNGNKILSRTNQPEYFHKDSFRQLHYLQVLTGDDSGTLFRHFVRDRVYYQLGKDCCYGVNDEGDLESLIYNLQYYLDEYPHHFTLLDVNEEEIVQDNSNEMPKLEAGKHVVRDRSGALYLILDTELDGLSGFEIAGGGWWGDALLDNKNDIVEVHRIFDTHGALCKSAYNESTLIWKRDDKAAEARKQYDELQRQIKQLQEQADKLGEKL